MEDELKKESVTVTVIRKPGYVEPVPEPKIIKLEPVKPAPALIPVKPYPIPKKVEPAPDSVNPSPEPKPFEPSITLVPDPKIKNSTVPINSTFSSSNSSIVPLPTNHTS
jgi:hypothetical protein